MGNDRPQGRRRLLLLNGLLIDSDIELRTASSAAAHEAGQRATLRITLAGNAPAKPPSRAVHLYDFPETPADRQPYMTVWRLGGGFWVRIHGLADFRASATGDHVACMPLAQSAAGSLEQILIDQIIPRVMQLRGALCLHASAIEVGQSGALALLGPSGSGKSTVCAALCRRGARMLCDDCLHVVVDGGIVYAHPGYGSLRLWPDSASALLESSDALPAASPHTDKLRLAERVVDGPRKLVQVLLLEPSGRHARIEPVKPHEAVAQLAAMARRLDPKNVGALHKEFDTLGAVVERVPTAWLRFTHDWTQLERLLDLIESCARTS